MTTLCMFLKPEVITAAEDREQQNQDIELFIKPAIIQAGLSVIDDYIDGLEVGVISDTMIQKIYKSDILIIDANWYPSSGNNPFSPYLYYYMAVGHARGNATILVTRTPMHLPRTLVRYHTLHYDAAEDSLQFILKFKATVDEIRQQQNTQPDNPIQDYLKQEEIARASWPVAEQEAYKERMKRSKRPKIVIRPVEPEWDGQE